MITNFEEITRDLNAEEKKLIPHLLAGFRAHQKSDPIKAPKIIKAINDNRAALGLKNKLTEPRLRKLCNLIRSYSLIPLIATSEGYYVSGDQEEIRKQVQSLRERAEAILKSANGLQRFIKDKENG